jgi:multiple sugar transport system substrate-binding protein
MPDPSQSFEPRPKFKTESIPEAPWEEKTSEEESFPPTPDLSQLEEEVSSEEAVPLTETTPSPDEPTPPPETTSSESLPSESATPVTAFHAEGRLPLGAIKKILAIFLILALVVGFVFLAIKFGLPRFQQEKEITLTYWGLWEPESVMNQVIADWQKDHPKIKIEYSLQSKQQYRERVQSALARGEGPDIFRYHVTWLPMLKNQLDPLPAEVMSASQFESTFYPVAATQLRSGTNYLGLPLEIDTLALFYNKEIFQTAGKTPPTTWDELRKTAIELTTVDEAGKIQTAGVALGTTNNVEHWSDILGLMMLQNEADLTNPTGSLAEDALSYYTIFNTTDQVWDLTLPNSIVAFASGKVAMAFGYSWDIFEIKSLNPDLEFGVVKAPQLSGTNVAWASFWVEGVNNKSEHKKEAWEFLQYLVRQETLSKLYQSESQLRLFGEPYSRVEMAAQLNNNPLASPFVEQAPQAQTWYLCSRTDDNGLNDKMINYFKDAVNAVNANQTPTEALQTAASGVSQLLSQYGLASSVAY